MNFRVYKYMKIIYTHIYIFTHKLPFTIVYNHTHNRTAQKTTGLGGLEVFF